MDQVQLLNVALIALHWWTTCCDACSCQRADPIHYYCKSEFTIRMRAKQRHQESEYSVFYDIEDLVILKATDTARQWLQTNKIWTPSSGSMCGLNLPIGQQLVLTGEVIDNNKPFARLCGYNQLWQNVTEEVKQGLAGGYTCATNSTNSSKSN